MIVQGEDIVPIPGTKRREYLEEKVGALEVKLTSEDLLRLNNALPRGAAVGAWYPEQMMRVVGR